MFPPSPLFPLCYLFLFLSRHSPSSWAPLSFWVLCFFSLKSSHLLLLSLFVLTSFCSPFLLSISLFFSSLSLSLSTPSNLSWYTHLFSLPPRFLAWHLCVGVGREATPCHTPCTQHPASLWEARKENVTRRKREIHGRAGNRKPICSLRGCFLQWFC